MDQTGINHFVEDLTGFSLSKSRLVTCNREEWNSVSRRLAEPGCEGFYSPSRYTGYVKEDSRFLLQNIYHELFGHGLYCENSGVGKELSEIDRQISSGGLALDEKIQQKTSQNLPLYEGFAVWLEYKISLNQGEEKLFEEKLKLINPNYSNWFESYLKTEELLGVFGVMAAADFPRLHARENIENIISSLFHHKTEGVKLGLWYGSKKSTSDMDLFLITDDSRGAYSSNWLDAYAYSREEVLYRLMMLDPAITDPIMTGEPVYGDMLLHEHLKNLIGCVPISEEAIRYNISNSDRIKNSADDIFDTTLQEKTLRYAKTSLIVAEELMKGNKMLTFGNIKQKYDIALA